MFSVTEKIGDLTIAGAARDYFTSSSSPEDGTTSLVTKGGKVEILQEEAERTILGIKEDTIVKIVFAGILTIMAVSLYRNGVCIGLVFLAAILIF